MSKKMRILIAVLTIVVIIIIAGIIMGKSIEKKLEGLKDVDFSSLDLGSVEDGTYTGVADYTAVKATVEVTVKDHVITDVTLVSHDNGQGKPAEVIVDDIVEKNSLDVDTISGATYSSNVIKSAVLNALTK